ncbi:hypothetical protein ACHAXR_012297 [Thalassiosira sp. AJA248-18]
MEVEDGGGWGRPRPKFTDLVPSTPEHSDDDGQESMNMMGTAPRGDRGNFDMQLDHDINFLSKCITSMDLPPGGFEGVPLNELTETYASEGWLNRGQLPELKKFYTTWHNKKKSPDLLWTSIFTCPKNGDHFACGEWKLEKGITIIDGVCWYKTKQLAKSAAAARALDCFSLRRCVGTEKTPYERCVDAAYLSAGDAPKLPELPPGVVLPAPLSEGNGVNTVCPPKQALNLWYSAFVKELDKFGIVLPSKECGPRDECFFSWSNQKQGPDLLWTSIFTCPLSGERFASGKHGNGYKEKYMYYCERGGTGMLIPQHEDGNEEDDGVGDRLCFVWYKKKKEAEVAAAGRAVDCLRHRDDVDSDPTPGNRYCEEIPYAANDVPGIWKSVSESVHQVWDCEFPPLPHDARLTTQYDVPDLHSFVEDERDEEKWRARYREGRGTVESHG